MEEIILSSRSGRAAILHQVTQAGLELPPGREESFYNLALFAMDQKPDIPFEARGDDIGSAGGMLKGESVVALANEFLLEQSSLPDDSLVRRFRAIEAAFKKNPY